MTNSPSLVSILGFNPHCQAELQLGAAGSRPVAIRGWGCACTLTHPQSGASWVIEVDADRLIRAGFPERDVWRALGAHLGTRADPTHGGAPVCDECLAWLGRDGAGLAPGEGICWCCRSTLQCELDDCRARLKLDHESFGFNENEAE